MTATTDRLFRHMAWANAQLFTVLQTVPEEVYGYREPGNDWTVGMILLHLVEAARVYVDRLGEGAYEDLPFDVVATHAQLQVAAAACAVADARLRTAAQLPEGMIARQDNPTKTRARSTVLAQAIHHATEHRAQIAGALVANGCTALDLDALDVWSLGNAEGKGE
jgi:uncharacterized damage-inducible protein DinB